MHSVVPFNLYAQTYHCEQHFIIVKIYTYPCDVCLRKNR